MRLVMALVMAIVGVSMRPALAQVESREGIALQNQILELRRDVQSLRNDQGRSPQQPLSSGSALGGRTPTPLSDGGDMTATLLDRVSRLEDQVRALNGRLDELNNTQQRQGADLSKQIADLQFRLDNAGPGAAGAAAVAGPHTPPVVANGSQAPVALGTLPVKEAASPPRRTPELSLQEGNAALARRDYAGAATAARQVLATAKGTPSGYNAQFLLAQALAGQRDFNNAALAYNDTYTRNKQGARAQDSLVGLAASLSAINQKPAACGALDALRGQFPQPRRDIAARSAALRTSSGCRP